MIVERQEFALYAESLGSAKRLLELPPPGGEGCSIPARNFAWEHSVCERHDRHWVVDDNISGFFRLNRNLKAPVADGTIFRAMEDFADRFSNVALAGPNYFMFAPRKAVMPPLRLNTRVYSCILVKNDIPFRWRGRYNEDTDLSLRILKAGLVTVLFNAFLCFKQTTMTARGGNTESLYRPADGSFDGRLRMATSLWEQHPDVVKVTRKWGRWQHHVDYRKFAGNRPLPKPGLEIASGTDDYGMRLEVLTDCGE
jgi:hypothetical protein